jgi:hypothetical protein
MAHNPRLENKVLRPKPWGARTLSSDFINTPPGKPTASVGFFRGRTAVGLEEGIAARSAQRLQLHAVPDYLTDGTRGKFPRDRESEEILSGSAD